jgi:hypothetical protein
MGRTREVSKILSSNTLLATDAELAAVQSSLGLISINRTIFSAQSSVSVDNVFTSTYDTYKVIIQITGISNNDASFFIRYRNAGADRSTNYNSFIAAGTRGGTASNLAQLDSTDGYKLGEFKGSEPAQNYAFELTLQRPTQDTRQQIHIMTAFIDTGGNFRYGAGGGSRTSTGANDGFTIRSSAGNFTGYVDTYAYKK